MTKRKMGPVAEVRCHYCNEYLRDGAATRDHIVPKALGGPNALWNIVLACRKCNWAKADALPTCSCPKCITALGRWRMTRTYKHLYGDGRPRCLIACASRCAFPNGCFVTI